MRAILRGSRVWAGQRHEVLSLPATEPQFWRWAGKHRQSNKNLGVDAYRIPIELRQLLEDCRYWIDNSTYESDEIAVRFHHRLVRIHPYPSGNGRQARLATDLLLVDLGRKPFSWGRVNLVDASKTRTQYFAALRAASLAPRIPIGI